jgi:hypothetical protein
MSKIETIDFGKINWNYCQKWMEHGHWLPADDLPRETMEYGPRGQRLGKAYGKWKDQ